MFKYGIRGMSYHDGYDRIREQANKVVALNRWGAIDTQICYATKEFCNSYFELDEKSFGEDVYKFRKGIAELIMETRYFHSNCEFVRYTYMKRWGNQNEIMADNKTEPLTKSLVILDNLSYCSDDLAIGLADEPRFLNTLNQILGNSLQKHFAKEGEPKLKVIEDYLMKSSLGIVNNISRRETTISKLRDADLMTCLKPFLKSQNTNYALLALASLAGIINEEECDVINSNKEIVLILFDFIRKGMKERMRRYKGWSCQESVSIVKLLARNDANIQTLVDLGVLKLLVEMARIGDYGEQYESVSAIWLLCFNEYNQALITRKTKLGVYDLLLDLLFSKSGNIKNVCYGALWTLKDALKKSGKYKKKVIDLLAEFHAGHNANMETLVNLGALEFLVEMARNGDDDEQNRKPELGVVDLLVDLKSSKNQKIKKACIDALWILRDTLKNSSVEKYREIGEQIDGKQEYGIKKKIPTLEKKKASSRGHVMISYQWADQQVVKNVRDNIKARGYKVWMDIDNMKGDTLQAMAEAVEGADVFLMCMSNKYKHSAACRDEATYAQKLGKTIIPLLMETGYIADGWLGILLGMKLFFEFSPKYPFEVKMEALLNEIDGVLGGPGDVLDSGEATKTIICNLL